MNRILFLEFWNCTPHLQTSLELSYKLSQLGDSVHFLFGGHTSHYIENVNFQYNEMYDLPEVVGSRLIKNKNIKFNLSVEFPKIPVINISPPNTLEELLEYKYKDFFIGRAAASSLMFELGHSAPEPLQYQDRILDIIQSGIEVYEFSKKYIIDNKINSTYVFNGRFCNQAAVAAAAKSVGIKVLYHERGCNKNKYYLEEFVPHDMNKVQKKIIDMWNEAAFKEPNISRKIAIDFFENGRSGKEMGWKSFITDQTKDALPIINKSRRNVTYFSTNDDEYAALTDICTWGSWKNQYSALNSLIKVCKELKNIDLHIRLHPNMKNKHPEDTQKWKKLEAIPEVNLIHPESPIDTYKLIEESDLVVVAGSTVGLESVYWGTPCINLGPSYYSNLQAVYQPKSEAELKELLMSIELLADREKAMPFGYYFNYFGFPFEIYKPIDLHSGAFLGFDITKVPTKRKKNLLKKYLQKLSMFEIGTPNDNCR